MRLIVLVSVLLLSACGVADVATSAATNAKLQAAQAKQGRDAMDRINAGLDAATKSEQKQNATADPAE